MAEMNNGAREILTVECTLNWVFLATPVASKKYPNNPPKYKVQGLLEPSSPQVELMRATQRRLAVATWGSDAQQRLIKLQSQDKLVLHDGNMGEDENAKGKVFFTATHKKPVTVVATLGNENVKLAPGHALYPYSGCKGAVMFEMYVYNRETFACQLMGVQFLEHGQAFSGGGGRIATPAEFGINPAAADAAIPMTQADVGAAGGLF